MAHFRGYVKGNRSLASRLGTKESGLVVRAQSWGWDVEVSLQHSSNGSDYAEVELVNHHFTLERRSIGVFHLGNGTRQSREVASLRPNGDQR